MARGLMFKRMLEISFNRLDSVFIRLHRVHQYARTIQRSNADTLVQILDECDRSLSSVQLTIWDDKAKQVERKLHWSNELWPHTWETNFLCYAIGDHLHIYVKAKLAASPSLLEPQSGIPLLAFCFLSREPEIYAVDCLFLSLLKYYWSMEQIQMIVLRIIACGNTGFILSMWPYV
jgi:hypothetical protein